MDTVEAIAMPAGYLESEPFRPCPRPENRLPSLLRPGVGRFVSPDGRRDTSSLRVPFPDADESLYVIVCDKLEESTRDHWLDAARVRFLHPSRQDPYTGVSEEPRLNRGS